MKTALAFVSTVTIFFALVGGFVGMLAVLPFADQVLVHRSIWGPEFLLTFLLGYLVLAIPLAALAGVVYGFLRFSITQTRPIAIPSNICLGLASGVIVTLVIFVFGDFEVTNQLLARFEQLVFVVLCSTTSGLLFELKNRKQSVCLDQNI